MELDGVNLDNLSLIGWRVGSSSLHQMSQMILLHYTADLPGRGRGTFSDPCTPLMNEERHILGPISCLVRVDKPAPYGPLTHNFSVNLNGYAEVSGPIGYDA